MPERQTRFVAFSRPEKRIRLVIITFHRAHRHSLIRMLLAIEGLDLAGVAGDGKEGGSLCRHVRPDVVLLDLRAGDVDGLALAEDLRGRWPWLQILILKEWEAAREGQSWPETAGVGYLLGEASRQDLAEAVRKLFENRPSVPGWNGSHLRLRAYPDQVLNNRERRVFRLIKSGLSDAQLAEQLAVNELTARFHVRNVVDKLGVSTRQEVAAVSAPDG